MTPVQNFLDTIRQHIAGSDLDAALQQLRTLLDGSPQLDEALHHSARWKALRQQIRLGTVSHAEATLTKNQVQQALLDFLKELESDFPKGATSSRTLTEGTLAEAFAHAVSIVNSKNVNTGAATAGHDIQFGDRTEVHHHHGSDPRPVPPHALTPPPFLPEIFLGREDDLRRIHDKLFTPGGNLLLLVNGEGGVGKTSVASRYYHRYHLEYAHVAWVLSEKSIANALLLLAHPLGLQFDPTMNAGQRLHALLAEMANLQKPCLLVLDNANEPGDLAGHYPRLRSCSNFHLLLTTRITQFQQATTYRIEALPEDKALEMFEKHFRRLTGEERALFGGIRTAAGGNTLVIELLAKNLAALNRLRPRYALATLLADLRSRGLLLLTQSAEVDTDWHSQGTMRHAKPEEIIAAMYDLGDLQPQAVALLSAFAVLPAESIGLDALEQLLPDADLETHLLSLADSGWIEHNPAAAAFKCSPVVQEVVKKSNPRLPEDCRALVSGLIEALDQDVLHIDNYKHATRYARYAESVMTALNHPDTDLATLCQNTGNFHTDTGNLGKAMSAYQKMVEIQLALLIADPGNPDFKNGLAVSYEKLGRTHTARGNLQQALTFFEDETRLFEELHEAFPQNVEFKYGLQISYEKLGDTFTALGNLNEALSFYEKENQLIKELHEAFPQNVEFKKGLAVSYSKLGDTHRDIGNLQQALRFFQKDNQLSKELHEAFLQNVSFKNGLAISYEKLGGTHTALGNLQQALTFFEERSRLGKELHEAFPANVSFKNGLAISYSKLGDTHTALGNLQQALRFNEKANETIKELHEAFPISVSFKNGLAISYEKLGGTYTALGNLQQALTFFEDETRLFEELHEAFPQNVEFKYGLAISYAKLGGTHTVLGNLQQALRFFQNDNQLSKELYEAFPANVDFKNGLAISYAKLGVYSRDQLNDKPRARGYFQQAESLWAQLVQTAPLYVQFQRFLEQVRRDLSGLE